MTTENRADATLLRFGIVITRNAGDVRELRSAPGPRGTLSGYVDNADAFARGAIYMSGKAPGCYFTLNPVKPDLQARASNRIQDYAKQTTADADILRRELVYIDIDAGQPSGISSTDAEQASAQRLVLTVSEYLISQGITGGSYITMATGNGYGILLAVDMPNDSDATAIVRRFLEYLNFRFSGKAGEAHIDAKVFNAGRIAKLPYTMVMKGDNMPDRPHRMSEIIHMPDTLEPVATSILQSIGHQLPEPPEPTPYTGGNNGHIDGATWLARYSIPILREKPWQGGTLWTIACQSDPTHNHGEAYLLQMGGGALKYECKHNSCAGKDWHWLREKYEPAAHWRDNTGGDYGTPSDEVTNRTKDFTLTDVGNARRLVQKYGHMLRYNYERKLWLVYVGTHWKWDGGALITKYAQLTVRAMLKQAARVEDENERKALTKHALASESNRAINAMIAQAQAIDGVPVKVSDLDTNHTLLNFPNGTMDLRTGTLRTHSADDMITICLAFNYDSMAVCQKWESFVSWAMSGDIEMITYLQRIAGYCLTGLTKEQVFFFFYGEGSNGKTTFTGTLKTMLGEYGGKCANSTITYDKHAPGRGHNEGLANLQGKRLVLASETADGSELAMDIIKDMTGQDGITASRKHEHDTSFMPTFKLVIYGNKKPVIKDTTWATWRRVKFIPWKQTISEESKDLDFSEKLASEYPGIMAWCVRGWLECQRTGLAQPSKVTEATALYRKDSDDLGEFLEECVLENAAQYNKSDMTTDYANWCATNEQVRISQRAFKSRLMERGVTETRGTGGVRQWLGIRKKTPLDAAKNQAAATAVSDKSDKSDAISQFFPHEEKYRKEYSEPRHELSLVPISDKTLNETSQYPAEKCPKCGGDIFTGSAKTGFFCEDCRTDYVGLMVQNNEEGR
jgi:P4 family phage/plasmid primase-like protien